MIKKNFQKLLFILLVFLLTFLGLSTYLKLINKDREKDGGFVNATATSSNKFVCEANNFECIKNLIFDLNESDENALLLGNSQLGAINQLSKGEINFGQQLSQEINIENENPVTVRSVWIPNATLGEFKEIYFSMMKCSTRIDNIIIPVFLDDMREQKIRKSLQNYSFNICGISQYLSNKKNKFQANTAIVKNSEMLDKIILKRIPVLKNIQIINSHLRVLLYKLRNNIFGINASSKRKIVKAAYLFNLESLKNIIESREALEIPTTIYIPPLLHFVSGKEIPYFKVDYFNFKNQMKDICNKDNCVYFDLDSIIPDNKWGYKDSISFMGDKKEIDFMHFTYDGHKIMAKKLIEILKVKAN